MLAIGTIDVEHLGTWWPRAFAEIESTIVAAGLRPAAAHGGTYDADLFLRGHGALTAFLPVAAEPAAGPLSRRAEVTVLPPAELAVAIHEGDDEEIDRTYAALGTWVNERGLSGEGPVRENHLTGMPPPQRAGPRSPSSAGP